MSRIAVVEKGEKPVEGFTTEAVGKPKQDQFLQRKALEDRSHFEKIHFFGGRQIGHSLEDVGGG